MQVRKALSRAGERTRGAQACCRRVETRVTGLGTVAAAQEATRHTRCAVLRRARCDVAEGVAAAAPEATPAAPPATVLVRSASLSFSSCALPCAALSRAHPTSCLSTAAMSLMITYAPALWRSTKMATARGSTEASATVCMVVVHPSVEVTVKRVRRDTKKWLKERKP